jgi:putative ABC transport system substrate-binding protein
MRPLISALASIVFVLTVDVGAVSAQQPGRVYRIGWLYVGYPGQHVTEKDVWGGNGRFFFDTLRGSGYIVGKNLVVDVRDAQGDLSQLPALAEALVATQPDVIVTAPATASTIEAMRATKTIPIVFSVGDPVGRGIVKSLVNHGGNATGQGQESISLKMWQLLRDAAPAPQRLGWVGYAPNIFAHNRSPEYRAKRVAVVGRESAQVGFELVDLMVDRLEELEPKVAALASSGKAALSMATDPTLYSWRAEIMSMAMRYRLPTACSQWFGWGQEGCLITYGADDPEMGRRLAAQVAKLLNGTKPADIPIEQQARFKLVVNAKTAKALDLTLPPSLLAAADEVIE